MNRVLRKKELRKWQYGRLSSLRRRLSRSCTAGSRAPVSGLYRGFRAKGAEDLVTQGQDCDQVIEMGVT